MLALDQRQCVLMVMLNLSAAFNTVCHQTLLDCLTTRYGIRGNAHAWVASYLTDKQFMTIKGECSDEQDKNCDVWQGLALGLWGSHYMRITLQHPLGPFPKRMAYHFTYMQLNDKQAYVLFCIVDEQESLERLEGYFEKVKRWIAANWLKLNESKTEFIIFRSMKNLSELNTVSISLGDSHINSITSVKSIGAHLISTLKMEK